MSELRDAVSRYAEAARAAYTTLRVIHGENLRRRAARRRGCARVGGKRVVWRFHGAGAYVHLAGRRGLDFDFLASPPGEIAGDLFHVARFCQLKRLPTAADREALVRDPLPPGVWIDPISGHIRISVPADGADV
jgi:hypothetical protein